MSNDKKCLGWLGRVGFMLLAQGVALATQPISLSEEGGPAVRECFAISTDVPVDGWVLVGRFNGIMRGADIVKLQVMERDTDWTLKQVNPMTGLVSDLAYTAHRFLPRSSKYVYRLKRIEGFDIVDVLEWPNQRYGWQLVVRTRPGNRVPQYAACEIEAALPGENLAEYLTLTDIKERVTAPVVIPGPESANLIPIPVQTDPPNAFVRVNGQLYEEHLGPVVTPCTIRLQPGLHTIALSLDFFETKVVSNYMARLGQGINWVFEPSPDLPWHVFEWEPPRRWRSTSLRVSRGDQVLIAAEGEWTIGGFHSAGPTGYSPDQFPEFYQPTDRRLWSGAPYGALLVRFGQDGATNYFAQSKLWHITDERGEIWLDVNADPDRIQRRRNGGKMTIRVVLIEAGRRL